MSLTVKNILYATDFSEAAEAALPYVRGLAMRYGAMVHAVHVHLPGYKPVAEPEKMSDFERAALEQIKIETEQLNAMLAGIPHDVCVCAGKLWPTLLNIAQQRSIDLIVIGTRGRTGAGRVLLGSVAEEIFRSARCPVLTIGPHVAPHISNDTEDSLELRQVLYATDFTPGSLSALPYAASLKEEYQAKLTVLHVVSETENGKLIHAETYGKNLLKRLRELLPAGEKFQIDIDFKIEHGVAAEKILQVATALHADLIVLGVRKVDESIGIVTHLSRPTAHRILAHAECPVLTVRG